MDVPFELHVALRYLLAKRKQAFISLVSFISMLGVGVGVMAVVVALAMMTGLQLELQDRIVGSNAHIYVWNTDGIADYHAEVNRLKAMPHVVGAAPGILGQGLVSASRETVPIQIKGIDAALEPEVTDIRKGMLKGSLDDLTASSSEQIDGILLGKDLATKLGVSVGDSVSVLTPQGTLSPMGMIPRARRLRVAGIFSLRLFEFDSTYGYVSLAVAKRLLDKDRVDFIQLRVDNIWIAPEISKTISAQLGKQYLTEDWQAMNGTLFAALWLEKIAVSLAIGLIVMVAALNIVASLILLVMDKSRDIAILKTMGASVRSVTIIFMLQGLIIGVVGTTSGAALGVTLSRVLDRYHVIHMPADVYQVSYLPFTVLPLDILLVVSMAVIICFLATIYPSRQAAHLDPAQALRYE
jgi:lipoprotein-releasing system permease protein